MPSPCVVPFCNGNYKNGPKVRVYSFPREKEQMKKWISAIKRDNFTPTTYSKVCELHFRPMDFVDTAKGVNEKSGRVIEVPLKIRRLHSDAVPSQFPNLPSYFSSQKTSRESPDSKKCRLEQHFISRAAQESCESKSTYDETRTFTSLQGLCDRVSFIDRTHWIINKLTASIMIFHVVGVPAPKIKYSLVVDDKLSVTAYYGDLKLKKANKFAFPCNVNNMNTLNDILDELKKLDVKNGENLSSVQSSIIDALQSLEISKNVNQTMVKFLIEQISFIGCNKHTFRYSTDSLILSSLLFTISPQAYRFLRKSNIVVLPHQNTVQRLCASYNLSPLNELNDSNFLIYIRKKIELLEDHDKLVILMCDEIHLKEYFDYKGGNIVGVSYNSNSSASSAHVFMIKSVLSKFKDVVHVLPVKTLTGEALHLFIKNVIVGLEEIGFSVLCVITDNNSINRKAMSYFHSPPKLQFVYPHPVNSTKPLFFLIDSVHLLKCIRNNWLNQKNSNKCFFYPKFGQIFDPKDRHNFKTASLHTLKLLHEIECNSLIKFGFKLSLKALAPTHLERQNVNLVLQLFNEFVAQGLIELGDKHNLPHYQDTADFITLILTWWQILNVKFISKGSRLNNAYQTPLTFDDTDDKMIFLHKFLDWLDEWDKMQCTTGMFSKETQAAMKLTICGITQIAKYCKEELNIDYILPGKFQTDDLESRFGFYRQMAGCQYHISLQQLFECENKLRMQSVLRLKVPTKSFGEIEIQDFQYDDDFTHLESVDNTFPQINISSSDIAEVKTYLPVIIYLGGYCIFSGLKKESCVSCKELHLVDKELVLNLDYDFVKNLDRGRLMFPQEHIVNAVLYTYIVVKKLCFVYESNFLKIQNQRNIVTVTAISLLDDDDMLHCGGVCENYHSVESVIKKVVWVSANIFLNNYCKQKNDDIVSASHSKRKNSASTSKKELFTKNRKLETLMPP